MSKFKQYIIQQLIPYAFWFMVGAGALLVYLAVTDYRCRLGEASLTQLQIRAMEREAVTWMHGPVQPGSIQVVQQRRDWLPTTAFVAQGL